MRAELELPSFQRDLSAIRLRARFGPFLHGVQGVPSSNLGAPTNLLRVLSGDIADGLYRAHRDSLPMVHRTICLESRRLGGHFKSDLSSAINALASDEAEGFAMPLTKLKSLARERIQKGQLPPVAPAKMLGGKGDGARCAVCDKTNSADEVELEVEQRLNGSERSLHFHVLCHAAWQLACGEDSRPP